MHYVQLAFKPERFHNNVSQLFYLVAWYEIQLFVLFLNLNQLSRFRDLNQL